jgi:predicted negative regulator of RcsB-dependent stress response
MKKVARELLKSPDNLPVNQKGLYNFQLAEIAINKEKTDKAIKLLKEAKEQYKNLRKQLKLNEISDKEIIKRFSTLGIQIPNNILQQINK